MNQEFTKINRSERTLSAQLARQIATKIMSGELKAGSPLPGETKLSQQWSVSRASVRAAMQLLNARGLLDVQPYKATRVCSGAQWNLLDPLLLEWLEGAKLDDEIYRQFEDLRLSIEPGAAAAAAAQAKPDDLSKLSKAYLALVNLAKKPKDEVDFGDWASARIVFHETLLEASNNRFYAPFSQVIGILMRRQPRNNSDPREKQIMQYKALYKAIQDKDVEGARIASEAMQAAVQNQGHAANA